MIEWEAAVRGIVRSMRAATLPPCLVLLLIVAFPCPARAQQKEPLAITQLGGFVEVGARARREERSFRGIVTSPDSDELKLEEALHLDLGGYVYLPRFLRYQISGDARLLQETMNGSNDVLTGGRWSLHFFEEHPWSLDLFREDRQTQVEQPFFRTFEETSSGYGARLRFRAGPLPGELGYTHRSTERSGTDSYLDRIVDEFSIRARHTAGEWSRTNLDYRRTEEENLGRTILSQSFFADNRMVFDASGRRRFSGNVRFREQDDGLSDSLSSSAAGQLSWEHGPTLLSQYRAQFQRNDTRDQTSNDLSLDASLRHRLYQSLVSTIDAHARLQDASFGRTERFGGSLSEDYTKRLGQWGRLDIDLAPYAELARNRPTQTAAQAVDEPRVMPDILPVQLVQEYIDPTTIVVTDAAGSIIYLEGIDYLIVPQGPVTELTRLATGNIAPDETVLVDYVYRLTGPSDLLSRGVKLYTGLSIGSWLVLYTGLRLDEEEQLSGDPGRQLESRDRQVVGARVSRGWTSARLEFERENSESRSFTGISQSFSVSPPKRSWWHASFVGSGLLRNHDDVDERLMRLASTLRLGADVARRGRLDLALDYQMEEWSGDGSNGFQDLQGFGARLALSWQFRNAELSLGGSISRIDRNGQQENLDRLFLRLRRRF